jgi:hypothetical protein
LWVIFDKQYEKTEGFHTLRAESLWLPASPFQTQTWGSNEGFDSLAVSSFIRRLGNLYGRLGAFNRRDYSGKFEYALFERFRRLSHNEPAASQIPSLILNDGLAAGTVGTKTPISSKFVKWPASLEVDDTRRGFPRTKVSAYKRVIRYDIRFAIPAFVVLTFLLLAIAGASFVLATSRSVIRTMHDTYNQTSAGRLATNLLRPGEAKQSSKRWARGDGKLRLSFGQIGTPEKDYFCKIIESLPDVQPTPNSAAQAAPEEIGSLLTANSNGGSNSTTQAAPEENVPFLTANSNGGSNST